MKSRNASGGPAWLLRAEHPTAGTRGKVTAVRVHSCGSLGFGTEGNMVCSHRTAQSSTQSRQGGQGENPGRILTFISQTTQG